MKKLIIIASLFAIVSVSAQENESGRKQRQKPTVEQQMQEFDNLNISSKQRSKLEKLVKERDAEMENNRPEPPQNGQRGMGSNDRQGPPPPPRDGQGRKPQGQDGERPQPPQGNNQEFDQRVQKILNEDQYKLYQENHRKHRQHDPILDQDMEENTPEELK